MRSDSCFPTHDSITALGVVHPVIISNAMVTTKNKIFFIITLTANVLGTGDQRTRIEFTFSGSTRFYELSKHYLNISIFKSAEDLFSPFFYWDEYLAICPVSFNFIKC